MSTSKPLTDRQAALATPSFSRTDLEAIDRALSKTIAHLVAFANTTPYLDDPRWSPWTRFQKPLAAGAQLPASTRCLHRERRGVRHVRPLATRAGRRATRLGQAQRPTNSPIR